MKLEELAEACSTGHLGSLKAICLEVNPPRGVAVEAVFERLAGNLDGIDFLNITDSALAKMRLSAIPFAALAKSRLGVEPLVNISCRDRNLIAIQGDLLAAWATGVRSIVALTGDAVTIGDAPETKGVFEVNSVGLLNVINTLNSGKDLVGKKLKGAPAFISGVVVNPNARNPAVELRRLAKKVAAGAVYALSQPVFDEEHSLEFFKSASELGIAVFMGLLPIKSTDLFGSINKIPGIKISPEFQARISESGQSDISDVTIQHCLELAKLNRPYVSGYHVVSGATPSLALRLARELVKVKHLE